MTNESASNVVQAFKRAFLFGLNREGLSEEEKRGNNWHLSMNAYKYGMGYAFAREILVQNPLITDKDFIGEFQKAVKASGGLLGGEDYDFSFLGALECRHLTCHLGREEEMKLIRAMYGDVPVLV